jgi:predicted metal-dependent phosphoesterase TrpH
MNIDLHLHTLVSDGIASPADVVRRAAAAGLTVVAVADHDDTGGTAAALAAGREHGITVVPAIELTARVDPRADGTVHLLGYGIDPANAELARISRLNRLGKRAQVVSILEKLAALGVDLADEDVGLDRSSEAYVGRNRVASALVLRGLAKDRLKAFKRYLNPGARAFAPAEVVPAADALAAIRAAGGIAVLAHPTEENLERHLGKLCELGLEGIEVWRPKAAGTLLERIERAREKRGLLATGGSDWHGLYPGTPLGEFKVRADQVQAFLDRVGVK